MMTSVCRIAIIFVLAVISAAEAAPAVPPSEQPGRERYRFTPSPLDRFMQPTPQVEPLIRWQCGNRAKQRRSKRSKNC